MSRFLIVSFSGLAVAFYHLSGGADFKPPERPSAVEVARGAPVTGQKKETSSRMKVFSTEVLAPTPVLRRETPPPAQPFIQLATQAETEAAAPQAQPGSLVLAMGRLANTDASDDLRPQQAAFSLRTSGLQIGSLAGGIGAISQMPTSVPQVHKPAPPQTTESHIAQRDEARPVADIRHVRASRVNMRFGPGTEFPVVARLLAHDRVHVLSDNEAGWLLLSDPKSGQVGWIAASLLSAKGS